MARKAKGLKAEKRAKKVSIKLVKRERDKKVASVYVFLEAMLEAHHPHLADAKFAICWRYGWKTDVDGRVKVTSVKKGSDLDHELHGFDFVVLVNHELWNSAGFGVELCEAYMDDALCRCEVSRDRNGEPQADENGRTVYRIRRPDVEVFQEVIARHGMYSTPIAALAQTIVRKVEQERPLLDRLEEAEGDNQPAESADPQPAKKPSANGNGKAHKPANRVSGKFPK